MAPGDRIQILFKAGLWKTYNVTSLSYNAGSFTYPEDAFMKIKVAGIPVLPHGLPTKLEPHEDFRNAHIDNVRTLTFTEGGTSANPTYLLDGKEFDPNVVNQIITLGTTEEWRLVNNSVDTHPFHIHINPFQVISANGVPVDRYGYDDTFPVPAHSNVVIRTKYQDFDGKYVLHCHILFHEDHGMMQVVEVVKPGNDVSSDNGMPDREGMPGMEAMHNTSGVEGMGMGEEKQIMVAAQKNVVDNTINGIHVNVVFGKQIGEYAIVRAVPLHNETDPLQIILQKVRGKWKVIDSGTAFPNLEGKVPSGLFSTP